MVHIFKVYRRHYELIEKKNHISLKKPLQQVNTMEVWFIDSEKPLENLTSITLSNTVVSHFKNVAYDLYIMRHTACLMFNPIMVDSYAARFSCTAMVHVSGLITAST